MIETASRSVRTIDRGDDPIIPALARLLGDAYPRLALHDAAALERNEQYVRANIADGRTRYAVIADDDDLAA